MKTISMVLVALAIILIGVANAQSSCPVSATIPFDFYVADELLPAGEYATCTIARRTVIVRAEDSPWRAAAAMFFITSKAKISDTVTSKLIFNKYSDQRIFLSQIWREGANDGVSLPKSRRERDSVTSQLITGNRPTILTVLAKAR